MNSPHISRPDTREADVTEKAFMIGFSCDKGMNLDWVGSDLELDN